MLPVSQSYSTVLVYKMQMQTKLPSRIIIAIPFGDTRGSEMRHLTFKDIYIPPITTVAVLYE